MQVESVADCAGIDESKLEKSCQNKCNTMHIEREREKERSNLELSKPYQIMMNIIEAITATLT